MPACFEDFEFHAVDWHKYGLGKIGWIDHVVILPTETGQPMTGFCENLGGVRTDRLVAVLLLLQRREQVTAAEVARELEVSERTARRDLDALAMAGVPVYSLQGRGGGWRLVGGARTDLSGLTESEARALFLVAGPASVATPTVKAALRKLVHALPEPFRGQAEAAASSLVVDPRRWGASRAEHRPPRFLDELQDAVIRGVQVRLGYVDRENAVTERTVHPLGIVAKGASWYLVTNTEAGRRTFRIDRVSSAVPTGDRVHRPEDFDLAESWRAIADEVDVKRTPFEVQAVCVPHGVGVLRIAFGGRLEVGGSTTDGRVAVVIRGQDEYVLAGELAGLADWIEVTGPPGVRGHLASIGTVLVERYG
ncbi:Predicted DNA-binding transcriptional regulator YafY, contains an HTH and WYL domains [Lentzea albidocapillata subsp. violacea]|uniref:Predicted DNA-binding transcriptional regulator YafY, contains an HTH and WYL domains n=1 Tax=Lentzea albidocapillata subsp. violacea TaxID=128104 RepID=A0A1G8TSI6_9PSEU|nr:Predicted DNA-binding transcriptional regulator YafY, contains an HTH and WYL domains [Lentzea albidocapillata subsp. violacea]